MTDNAYAPATPFEGFEHINLADIDDSAKPIDENVYTLEVNKLEPQYIKINKASSPFCGQEILVLKGSYTVVDDEKYSGRKLWQDFWTNQDYALKSLKKQMNATGVLQTPGETLSDYARQFALLNPPARFQAKVTKGPKFGDPDTTVNSINLFSARPV